MEIEKILTPSGIKALNYFSDKTEYHFASITMVADNSDKCYISMRKALYTLAEAGILNACPTGKMVLYMRNPNSNFLTIWRALITDRKEAARIANAASIEQAATGCI